MILLCCYFLAPYWLEWSFLPRPSFLPAVMLGNSVWPQNVEEAFMEALAKIPKLGRRKIVVDGKPSGRNELVAAYIFNKTGKKRTRKQVSSHIQVLKNTRKDEQEIMDLLSDTTIDEGVSDNSFLEVLGQTTMEYSGSRDSTPVSPSDSTVEGLEWPGERIEGRSSHRRQISIASMLNPETDNPTSNTTEMQIDIHRQTRRVSPPPPSLQFPLGYTSLHGRSYHRGVSQDRYGAPHFYLSQNFIFWPCQYQLVRQHNTPSLLDIKIQCFSEDYKLDTRNLYQSRDRDTVECTTTVLSFGETALEVKEVQESEYRDGQNLYSFKLVNEWLNSFLARLNRDMTPTEVDVALRHLCIIQQFDSVGSGAPLMVVVYEFGSGNGHLTGHRLTNDMALAMGPSILPRTRANTWDNSGPSKIIHHYPAFHSERYAPAPSESTAWTKSAEQPYSSTSYANYADPGRDRRSFKRSSLDFRGRPEYNFTASSSVDSNRTMDPKKFRTYPRE
ncbi:MAG: TEA/ATTS domain family-domain-containing protein [Podila humilis]|nr:MAG: TEA/ATTS domain family-domain-containing protein [Podila humilis]